MSEPVGVVFCRHGVYLGDANPNRPCPECAKGMSRVTPHDVEEEFLPGLWRPAQPQAFGFRRWLLIWRCRRDEGHFEHFTGFGLAVYCCRCPGRRRKHREGWGRSCPRWWAGTE